MSTSTLARLVLVLALVPWFAHCDDGGGGGGTDSALDTMGDTLTDSGVDVPPDTPPDSTTDPGTAWNWCAKGCSMADDCCLSSGQPCGTYPNKWTCDGVCMTAGCDSDGECVTWATTLGLPGADGYKCSTSHLYWTAGYCVPGCTTPADCCPSGEDCSAYPQRRLCEDGGCRIDGCLNDTECQTWAAGVGLTDPSGFVCRTFEYSDTATCAHPCSSGTDCCPSGSCGTFPNHVDCIAGHCLATCTDDGECRDWAVSTGLPDPIDYVCHSF